MAVMTQQFYNRDTLTVAQELLGKYLVRRWEDTFLFAKIVETEGYIGRMDKACHAFGYKKTPRTQVLFFPAGHIYVYLIYGMHYCLNFVTEPEGEPAAVLLRGLSFCSGGRGGVDQMSRLRYGLPFCELTAYQKKNFFNGPGKLCRAMAIDKALNQLPCTGGDNALFVCDSLGDLGLEPEEHLSFSVEAGPRINVDYAGADALLPWRFLLREHKNF